MFWPKIKEKELKKNILEALGRNIKYQDHSILGFPGSFLDRQIFYDIPELANAPFLKVLVENPNHIGCHTLTQSETAFVGTHQIELDLLRICAEEILQAKKENYDGYVSTGGTESNLQAMWIYRNYFRQNYQAQTQEIAVIFSDDTHYSIPKGIDVFNLTGFNVPVDPITREIYPEKLNEIIDLAQKKGFKYFIVFLNMGTTMFGSVDEPGPIISCLEQKSLVYKIHVDAAFGGFIYPFTHEHNPLNFTNPHLTSFTLDAHKMLQAPYGTGIFIIRKNYMQYVCTEEARYVHGKDYTLCGSRSGANAIAVWMILNVYGSEGGKSFLKDLMERTNYLCEQLDAIGINYYRNPFMNIVSINNEHINKNIADKYFLVPDRHEGKAHYWKIVVMDHVDQKIIDAFLHDLRQNNID